MAVISRHDALCTIQPRVERHSTEYMMHKLARPVLMLCLDASKSVHAPKKNSVKERTKRKSVCAVQDHAEEVASLLGKPR